MTTPRLSIHGLLLAGVALAAGLGTVTTVPAVAQQQTAVNSLPPALRAAVTAGNNRAIAQAIATLSGGNTQRATELAGSVVLVAQQMLTTNPQAAIAAAAAAVETVRNAPVKASSPQQTQSVVTIAARIFVTPAAIRTSPTQAAALASATLSMAVATNNAGLIATVAQSAVSIAEQTVRSNPAAAMQLASQSVQAVAQTQVTRSEPQRTLSVATTAARIIVQPSVQQVAPQSVAAVAIAVTQAVTAPAVYQVAPQTAVQIMANAHSTAMTQTIIAAAPQTATSITATLDQASSSTALSQFNPGNAAQVKAILDKRSSPQDLTTGPQALPSAQPRQALRQNNNTPSIVVEENPTLTGSPT